MATVDTFGKDNGGLESPARRHAAVSPSDSVDFPFLARGIYVGTGGDVSIVTEDDSPVIYKNVPTGMILPIRAKRVNQTDTDAEDLVAIW